MRSNEARVQILEDQPDEKAMEARIARIESDVAHIQQTLATVQVDVSKLRDGLTVANDAIAKVNNAVTALDGRLTGAIAALDGRLTGAITALDGRVTTAIATLEGKFNTLVARADATDKRIDGLHSDLTATNQELRALRDVVIEIRSTQKTILWVLAGLAPLITAGIAVAKAFHWI